MKSLQSFLRPEPGLLSPQHLLPTNSKQALKALLASVLIWHLSFLSTG
jgi:hypothetical protein